MNSQGEMYKECEGGEYATAIVFFFTFVAKKFSCKKEGMGSLAVINRNVWKLGLLCSLCTE